MQILFAIRYHDLSRKLTACVKDVATSILWRSVVNLSRNVSLNRTESFCFVPTKRTFQNKKVCLFTVVLVFNRHIVTGFKNRNGMKKCFKTCVCLCICFGLWSRRWFIGGTHTHTLRPHRSYINKAAMWKLKDFTPLLLNGFKINSIEMLFFDIPTPFWIIRNSEKSNWCQFYHQRSLLVKRSYLWKFYCVSFCEPYFIC